MDTVQILSHFIENNQILAYLFIFLITILEGEVVAISAGILVLLGALNFWLCLIFVLLGAVVKTYCGYFLGAFLHRKFNNNKFFQHIEKRVLSILPRFNKSPFWSIFFSKFIFGINHVVLLFSGYRKIKFDIYRNAEFLSTIVWAPLMIALGYFFSYAALNMSGEISKFLLIILLFIIGFFLLDKLITFVYEVLEEFYGDEE